MKADSNYLATGPSKTSILVTREVIPVPFKVPRSNQAGGICCMSRCSFFLSVTFTSYYENKGKNDPKRLKSAKVNQGCNEATLKGKTTNLILHFHNVGGLVTDRLKTKIVAAEKS